mmetsp:Transcript_40675/g.66258  ORF Transcript_40675/g.66258 Transcript_40675/m.66258 type:complete len:191 (-) Transcript_40675:35-607(-)
MRMSKFLFLSRITMIPVGGKGLKRGNKLLCSVLRGHMMTFSMHTFQATTQNHDHHQSLKAESLWCRCFSTPSGGKKTIMKDEDVSEQFTKGWGKGGQKINKVMNAVALTHIPTGIQVKCQKTRSLEANRGIARELLRLKVDQYLNGTESKLSKKAERIRKNKNNKYRKAKKKAEQVKNLKEDQEHQVAPE